MSIWLNTERVVDQDAEKPCHELGWCPYGQLVEEFELKKPRHEKFSCGVFGHDCPVFYHKEEIRENV